MLPIVASSHSSKCLPPSQLIAQYFTAFACKHVMLKDVSSLIAQKRRAKTEMAIDPCEPHE